MKQLIIAFVFLFTGFFSVSAQGNTSDNKTNAQGKKEGLWKGFYEDGKLRYMGHFKNDVPVDTFLHFFSDGNLKTLLIYRNSKVAYAKHYYSTNELMAEGKYINQKKDSIWQTYGAKGRLVTKGAYTNGAKKGLWETYYDKGNVAEKIYYDNDIEIGDLKTYYENGQVLEETQYKNGFLEGLTTFYDENGNKLLKGIYKKGVRDGFWIYYNSDGTVDKKVEYINGKVKGKNPNTIEIPEELKNNRKDYLEFDDLRGKIKYN